MSVLPTHREKEWKFAINDCNKKAIQGTVKYLDIHIIWDVDLQWSFNTTKSKIAAGEIVRNELFKTIGFVRSTKKGASLAIIIGANVNGAWVAGNHKIYWLREKH